MTAPIALQLYTVRDAMDEDFNGTVTKVAKMGYAGVETAGFPGTTPQAAGELFQALGLSVSSAHSQLPLGDQQNEVLETMAAIGAKRLICPAMGPEHYSDVDAVKRTAETFNEVNAITKANGVTFGLHNHWWEFQPVEGDGRLAYQVLMDDLDEDIFFQIDTYWVKTAGPDPIATIQALGSRAPLLHIKDGPCIKEEPMTAVGAGIMDIHGVIAAGEAHTEWLIVELDRCATDMLEAVEQSYQYLIREGLGHGR